MNIVPHTTWKSFCITAPAIFLFLLKIKKGIVSKFSSSHSTLFYDSIIQTKDFVIISVFSVSTAYVLRGDFKTFQPPKEGREEERRRKKRKQIGERDSGGLTSFSLPKNDIHSYLQNLEKLIKFDVTSLQNYK